ncbi:hypothetical protein LMG1864_00001 [Achromobacter ruhlandii]|nr:hypothetical protein LMG1864_00001 [Achromobacter ruhlandii]
MDGDAAEGRGDHLRFAVGRDKDHRVDVRQHLPALARLDADILIGESAQRLELGVQQCVGTVTLGLHQPQAGRHARHVFIAVAVQRRAVGPHEPPGVFALHGQRVAVAQRRLLRAQHVGRDGPAAVGIQQAPPAAIARTAPLRRQGAGVVGGRQHHHIGGQRQCAAGRGVEQPRRLRHFHLGQLLAAFETPRARAQFERLDHLALAIDQHVALVQFDQRGAFRIEARGARIARLDGPVAALVDIAPQTLLAHRGQAVLERLRFLERRLDDHLALLVDVAPGAGRVAGLAGDHGGQPFGIGALAADVRGDGVGAADAVVLPVGVFVGAGRRAAQRGQRHGQRQRPQACSQTQSGAHDAAPPGCARARVGAAEGDERSRTCRMVEVPV